MDFLFLIVFIRFALCIYEEELPILLDFGPSVAEGGGAVEDGRAGVAIHRIGDEVAHA